MYHLKYVFSILIFLHILVFNSSANAQVNSTPTLTLTPETGFYVESKDGFMGFKISTRLQQQLGLSSSLLTHQPLQTSMSIRRARIRVHGYFFEKKLTYFLQTQMDRGEFLLSNAEFRLKATENLQLNFGQLWPVAGRQFRTVSSSFQMVDRSTVARFYSPNYDLGVSAEYKINRGESVLAKLYASITHGEGMNVATEEGGYAYTGRFEILPFGDFKKGGDYIESDIYRESKPKLSIGASYYYNQDAFTRLGSEWEALDDDIRALYVDVVYKFNGFALLSEFADRTVDNEILTLPNSNSLTSKIIGGNGYSLQMGKFVTQKTEPTLRVSILNPHDKIRAINGLFNQQNTYTLGLNHFIRDHSIKIQFELNVVNEQFQSVEDQMYLQFLTQFSISF